MEKSNVIQKMATVFGCEENEKTDFAAERSLQVAQALYGQENVPEAFCNLCAQMAVEMLERWEQDASIEQIREGDVTISFRENNSMIEELYSKYSREIANYRKARW